MPRWAQSIRFRLAMAYALAIFAAGASLLAILYTWQSRQLNEPILVQTLPVVFEDVGGRQFHILTPDALDDVLMERIERDAYRRSLQQLRQASMAGVGFLVIVAFGSGWLLSGWTLRPIRRMVAVAREVSGTELSARIGLRGPDDELKDLADTFDAMLDRVQTSFEDRRRFVQDTSHELRNPLAVARTNLELVLDDPDADVEELRRAVSVAHGASDRMSHIVDELVEQARQQIPTSEMSPVDLSALAVEIAAEFAAGAAARNLFIEVRAGGDVDQPAGNPAPLVVGNAVGGQSATLGESTGVGLTVGADNELLGRPAGVPVEQAGRSTSGEGAVDNAVGEPGVGVVESAVDIADGVTTPTQGVGAIIDGAAGPGVVVRGDAAGLRRAITNLVANAVRLAPEGSTITIDTGVDGDVATVEVGDEGPGIDPADVEKVFERFWRGPAAGKGLGLGLSIVRRVAERHGGRADVAPNGDGGSTFRLVLPLPTAHRGGAGADVVLGR